MYNSSGREYILELDMNLNHTIFNNNLAYIKREIGKKNAKQLAEAGADVLVAGSYIFRSENPTETIVELNNLLK